MIIVIRGTNGSGKSYAVRQVLAKGSIIDSMPERSSVIRLPKVKRPVLVIGPYIDGRSMGGCDCIRRPSEIYELVDRAIKRHWHVLLEGVVLATNPWFEYMDAGEDVRYALLDPPIHECLQNIWQRQRKKGHKSPLSREAMDRKRVKAHIMFIRAKESCMTTARFTDADDVVSWTFKQLRSA